MPYNFVVDPGKSGFDTSKTWKQLTGTTVFTTPNLVSNADSCIGIPDLFRGRFTFNVNIPTATGDLQFGLLQVNQNVGAYFLLGASDFSCVSHDKNGVAQTTVVTLPTANVNAAAKYQIVWSGSAVEFYISGVRVAIHNIGVPASALSLYFRNTAATDMKILYIEASNVESLVS